MYRYRRYRYASLVVVIALLFGTPAGVQASSDCCDTAIGHGGHAKHGNVAEAHEHVGHGQVDSADIAVVNAERSMPNCRMDHIGIPSLNLKPPVSHVMISLLPDDDTLSAAAGHYRISSAPDRAPPNLGQDLFLIQETFLR